MWLDVMKAGMPWVMIGTSMFILGLVLFYVIIPNGNKDLENVKNIGTFVGLSGMGITLAGIVLRLISRNEQPIKENYDVFMKTLLKFIIVLILWQTGILSGLLALAGGLLLWTAGILQPTVMIGIM